MATVKLVPQKNSVIKNPAVTNQVLKGTIPAPTSMVGNGATPKMTPLSMNTRAQNGGLAGAETTTSTTPAAPLSPPPAVLAQAVSQTAVPQAVQTPTQPTPDATPVTADATQATPDPSTGFLDNLKASSDASYNAQQATMAQARDEEIAGLEKNYQDAVQAGTMSMKEAQTAFEAAKADVEQRAYQDAQATNLAANDRGIQNSQQMIGLQQGDNARANSLVNKNLTERDQRIGAIKDRLAGLASQKSADITSANSHYTYGLAAARAQADQAYNDKMFQFGSQNYFTDKQNAFDMSKLDKQHSYTLDEMAVAQGYDLSKMSEQQKLDLQKMAVDNGYKVADREDNQAHDVTMQQMAQNFDMKKLDKQHTYTLDEMAKQQGYDLSKMTQAQKNNLAALAVQNGYNISDREDQQKFQAGESTKAQNAQAAMNNADNAAAAARDAKNNSAQAARDAANRKASATKKEDPLDSALRSYGIDPSKYGKNPNDVTNSKEYQLRQAEKNDATKTAQQKAKDSATIKSLLANPPKNKPHQKISALDDLGHFFTGTDGKSQKSVDAANAKIDKENTARQKAYQAKLAKYGLTTQDVKKKKGK